MSEDLPVDGPAAGGTHRAPPLDVLMPWSAAPVRTGRDWVRGPDPASLRRRWSALTGAGSEAERAALFGPTRVRRLHSAVAPLPGHPAPGGRLGDGTGPGPGPVRILHGAHDRQWLLPDARLLDAPRPELWRVTGGPQVHLVVTPGPRGGAPALTFTTLVPGTDPAAGRPGRVRPLYRRPGGEAPNLAPGLAELLSDRLQQPVDAAQFLSWTAVAAHADTDGTVRVPLTADPDLWRRGVALGGRALWLHTRGAHGGDGSPPRLPGGRRPWVRAPLPARPGPGAPVHDAGEDALRVDEGRIAPVEASAAEYRVGGRDVLADWFAARAQPAAEPGTLAALHPGTWLQEWTSELLELITVLTLLAELRTERRQLTEELREGPLIGAGELHETGVLPPPASARRPATVLDPSEEGPDGQLALL